MKPAAGRAAPVAMLVAAATLTGCSLWRPTPAPAPSPHDACLALNDTLNAAVPPGQSLVELQARGIRVRTPLRFAPGTLPATAQPAGAAVQGLIAPDGTVVPGSPKTLRSVGEPQTASAVEGAMLSMSFDFDGPAKPSAPVPFTTTYAVCARS